MDNKPLVSILMTVYNRQQYIAQAIESVLASTYENFELIIVDDCSGDRSVEIAKAYEAKDNRVKVYMNEKNLGDYPNRNKAASLASGKYIKYLDSDDLIYPHGLEVMVRAMEQFPEAVVGMSFENYDGVNPLPILMQPQESISYHFFHKGLLYQGPSASIYRKDYFDAVGGFDVNYKVAADYHFNLRAASQHSIVFFHRDLIWWRQHEGQEIVVSNKHNDYIIFNYLIHKDILPKANVSDDLKQKILYNNEVLMARRFWKMLLSMKLKSYFFVSRKTSYNIGKTLLAFIPTKNIK